MHKPTKSSLCVCVCVLQLPAPVSLCLVCFNQKCQINITHSYNRISRVSPCTSMKSLQILNYVLLIIGAIHRLFLSMFWLFLSLTPKSMFLLLLFFSFWNNRTCLLIFIYNVTSTQIYECTRQMNIHVTMHLIETYIRVTGALKLEFQWRREWNNVIDVSVWKWQFLAMFYHSAQYWTCKQPKSFSYFVLCSPWKSNINKSECTNHGNAKKRHLLESIDSP